MKALFSRAAVLAAVAVVAMGSPAHAKEPPTDPILMYLKDHEQLPLAFDDAGAHLDARGDEWVLKPVESMHDLGSYLIVHNGSDQCLVAEPTEPTTPATPLALADCAEAEPWSVVFDDVRDHRDYRLLSSEGGYLGVRPEAEIGDGTEVMAVGVPDSLHDQEWLFSVEEQTAQVSPSEVEAVPVFDPKLPTTGAGVAVGVATGLIAVAGGAALVLWRRRALRAHW